MRLKRNVRAREIERLKMEDKKINVVNHRLYRETERKENTVTVHIIIIILVL